MGGIGSKSGKAKGQMRNEKKKLQKKYSDIR